SWRIDTRTTLREPLEERLRFELRRLFEARCDRCPVVVRKWIFARAPRAWLHQLARQLGLANVFPCGLPIHVRFDRCAAHATMLFHLLHQLPHLRVGRLHEAIFRRCGESLREIAEPHGWGDAIVVHGEVYLSLSSG